MPLDHCGDCLELGPSDGMVCAELVQLGKHAYGLDLERKSFDPRAERAGVRLAVGDVTAMPFPDGSMDLIYSFAAFEHFENPEACLDESFRVLRKEGYLYLFFGPIYTAPWGRHAYRQIPIPYCHYLFEETELKQYALSNRLESNWPYVNGFTLNQYRGLWKKYTSKFDSLFYKEHPTGGVGAELISEFPGCFKGKASDVNEFFVSAIELCWKKQARSV